MKFVIRSPFIKHLHETMLIDSEMTQGIENESKEICIASVDGVLAFFQETVFFLRIFLFVVETLSKSSLFFHNSPRYFYYREKKACRKILKFSKSPLRMYENLHEFFLFLDPPPN